MGHGGLGLARSVEQYVAPAFVSNGQHHMHLLALANTPLLPLYPVPPVSCRAVQATQQSACAHAAGESIRFMQALSAALHATQLGWLAVAGQQALHATQPDVAQRAYADDCAVLRCVVPPARSHPLGAAAQG